MITAGDMADARARPLRRRRVMPRPPPARRALPFAPAAAIPLRERLLLVVIYIVVVTSSIAFVEPSPHDALMFVLAAACLVARVHFDRKLIVLLLLLLVWNFGGLLSLLNVLDQDKTVQFAATSLYLAVAALR